MEGVNEHLIIVRLLLIKYIYLLSVMKGVLGFWGVLAQTVHRHETARFDLIN